MVCVLGYVVYKLRYITVTPYTTTHIPKHKKKLYYKRLFPVFAHHYLFVTCRLVRPSLKSRALSQAAIEAPGGGSGGREGRRVRGRQPQRAFLSGSE